MPVKEQRPLTDRERISAERRGAVFDALANDWTYSGRTMPVWLAAITADGRLRPEAARVAQEQIGPEAYQHVRALIGALDDRRTYAFACLALGRTGPRASEATSALAARMRGPSKYDASSPAGATESVERSFAADAIARIGADPATLPALVEALSDSYFAVGRHAADALGGLRGAAAPAVPALLQALSDPQLRLNAASALGQIGKAALPAGPVLAAVAKRNEWHESTAAAVEAIGKIAYVEGRDIIRAMLDDRYADVREAAVKAIARLGV